MMLLGAAAIAVPLALHFFYRARYRPLPWAAMTFLKQAIEQTSRRLRFQEILLLLLRCAVLLLLAFAIARPTFSGSTAAGRGESVDAVFVFDTSYSMGARDGEKSRIERAKEAALTAIENLPPRSTVQIFSCADRVAALGPISPGNLDQARQIVETIALSSLTTDLLPGITEAQNALERGAGTNKEVYIFTDMQKLGWDRQAAAIRAKCDEIKQRATLLLVRCGNPERPVRNVSVVDISSPGVEIPHSGTRIPFAVLIRNTGKEPVRNVAVALEVDGKSLEKEGEVIEVINPGETLPVTLTAKLDAAGPRVVTATITNDDLPGDNRLDKIIMVRDQLRIVIVDGSPNTRDPKEASSHYIRNAILPVSSGDLDNYFVRVTVVPADEAGPGLLGVCDVCILANVPASSADRPGIPGLSKEFVDRLGEYVKNGGGLLIGLGDNIVPARYNQVLGLTGANLLPFDLEDAIVATADKPFKIAPDTTDTPSYLERFKDEPFRTVMADVDVMKLIGIKTTGSPNGRVLMRMTDQKPFLSSRVIGEGEVILVAGSLDARWSNWPAKAGSYLSFARMTLQHLTGKAARGANRIAGETLIWNPTEATKPFAVRQPDGKRMKLGKATGGEGGKKLTVTAADTSLSGVYQIGVEDEEPLNGPRFAVAPDLRETDDLTSMTDGEVEQFLGFKPVFLQANSANEQGIANERSKREWTVWVLLALFFFVVGESFWAWYCGKAW